MSKPLPLTPHRGTKKSPQLTPRPELLPHRVWSFSIHARLMIEKQQAQEQRDLTVISSPTGSEENDELFRRICTYESQGSTNPVSITLSASPTTRSSTCDDVYHQRQAIGGPEASYHPNWLRIWSVSLQYQYPKLPSHKRFNSDGIRIVFERALVTSNELKVQRKKKQIARVSFEDKSDFLALKREVSTTRNPCEWYLLIDAHITFK